MWGTGNEISKDLMISTATKTRLLLVISSTLASFAVAVAAYEAFQNHKYRQWRSQYAVGGDWQGRLTVASPDDILMWEYRPYGTYKQLHVNRYGFRDRDFETPAKPPGLTRVAFLGDSVTLGMEVSSEESFVRQFESLAQRRQPSEPLQALNFGIDGYNTIQILELLRTKALQFEPDVAVYVMSLNDFDFEDSSSEKILYFRKPRSFFALNALKLFRRLSIAGSLWPSGPDFHRVWFETNRQTVFSLVTEMHGLLSQRNIRFELVLLPIFRFPGHTFDEYPLSDIHESILRYCVEQAVSFEDLLGAFRRAGGNPESYSVDIWHPNAAGHRIIAERLASTLANATRESAR